MIKYKPKKHGYLQNKFDSSENIFNRLTFPSIQTLTNSADSDNMTQDLHYFFAEP